MVIGRVGCRTRWSLDNLAGNVFSETITLSGWWECFSCMISPLLRRSDTSPEPFSEKFHVIFGRWLSQLKFLRTLRAQGIAPIDLGARLPIPTPSETLSKKLFFRWNLVFRSQICLAAPGNVLESRHFFTNTIFSSVRNRFWSKKSFFDSVSKGVGMGSRAPRSIGAIPWPLKVRKNRV